MAFSRKLKMAAAVMLYFSEAIVRLGTVHYEVLEIFGPSISMHF